MRSFIILWICLFSMLAFIPNFYKIRFLIKLKSMKNSFLNKKMTLCDFQLPLRSYFIVLSFIQNFDKINFLKKNILIVCIHINFYRNRLTNECARKKKLKSRSPGFFCDIYLRTYVLNINLIDTKIYFEFRVHRYYFCRLYWCIL